MSVGTRNFSGLLVGCALALAMIAPVFAQRDQSLAAKKTVTLTNLKQLAIGALLYAGDYDNRLPNPPDTDTVFNVLFPYLKNRGVFNSENPLSSKISWNLSIGGLLVNSLKDTAQVPMFFEPIAWADGSRGVAFVDAHCKFLKPDQWKSAQPKLNLKMDGHAKRLKPLKRP